MGRPKVPLISKRATLETALRILDEEGLQELSIRRLARELEVNGASLYHHFKNKDEILLGAAQLALDEARLMESPDDDWQEWLLGQARFYRDALLKHPYLVTVILSQHPHRLALPFYDQAVRLLVEQKVREDLVLALIESIEAFTFGSVLYTEAMRGDATPVDESLTALNRARERATARINDDLVWERAVRAIINAVPEPDAVARRGGSSRRAKAPVRSL